MEDLRFRNSALHAGSYFFTPLPFTAYLSIQKLILYGMKVDVLEYYDMYVKSAYTQHFLPAVLRVRVYVARNKKACTMTISRRNVMLRDCFTCQ